MKKILALILMSMFCCHSFGQQAKKKSTTAAIHRKNFLSIHVYLSDAKPNDTLTINIKTFFPTYDALPASVCEATIGKNGEFNFKIPLKTSFGYFRMFRKDSRNETLWQISNNGSRLLFKDDIYWLANDDINFRFNKIKEYKAFDVDISPFYKITVSGRGSMKYKAKIAADRVFHSIAVKGLDKVDYSNIFPPNVDTITKFLSYLFKRNFTAIDIKVARYLDNYHGLNKTDREVLKSNFLFDFDRYRFTDFLENYNYYLKQLRSVIPNYNSIRFAKDFKKFNDIYSLQINTEALARSNYFPWYAVEVAHVLYKSQHLHPDDSNNEMDILLSDLSIRYSGALRDRIIAQLASDQNYSPSQYTLGLIDHFVSDPRIKQYLSKLLAYRQVGALAYNYNLQDTSKAYHAFNDLKGKVIYEDFYFRGCLSCASLYKEVLHDVEEHFKTNKDVVFVSICVDKETRMFKDAVKDGLYNSGLSLNLFTNNEGYNHQMIKYYGLQSFPSTILIGKDGKIVKFNSSDIRNKDSLIAQINALLKQ